MPAFVEKQKEEKDGGDEGTIEKPFMEVMEPLCVMIVMERSQGIPS